MSYSYQIAVPAIRHLKPNTTFDNTFLETLVATTCRLLDVDSDQVYMKNKSFRVKLARWIVWEIMIAHKGFTILESGKIIGDHDHTTVMYALDNLPNDLRQNEFLEVIYKQIIETLCIPMQDILDLRERRDFNKKEKAIRSAKITF